MDDLITAQRARLANEVVVTGKRRLDVASLLLLLVGLTFASLAYYAIRAHGFDALLLVPAVVAATTGATNLIKREVPRIDEAELARIKGKR